MKKSFLILCTAGAIALAGCAKTGFVSAPSGTIGFRTTLASSTRATSTTTSSLASFNAYAIKTLDQSEYFSDVVFSHGADDTFTSEAEYPWPVGSLDFYAYAPAGNSQVVKGADCKTFTVTPSAAASEQVDFIFANTNAKRKDNCADGVAINFRHTESQITLKVKNSSANLKFEVAGWKLAYLSKSGKFTYGDENTDTENTQLSKTDWSELGTAAVTNTYEQSLGSAVSIAAGATEATDIGESFILIPQSQTAAASYESAGEGAAADGSYIAVKFIIRKATDDSVVYSDGDNAAWAMWPVDFEWEPGRKYTYVVDLSGCGYSETNTDDNDADLDKVYEGAVIKFVDVTVDEFVTTDDIEVTMPEESAIPVDALPGVFSVGPDKQVYFSKGNLFADGDNALYFEANQYDTPRNWDTSHVSHFTWSDNLASAVSNENSGDYLFCDESHKVSVNGSDAIYYALSTEGWQYLLNKDGSENIRKGKYRNEVTVCGINSLVIAPDTFTGTIENSYDVTAWATAEAAGLVCLPAAGILYNFSFYDVGAFGFYWSSSAPDSNREYAYNVNFNDMFCSSFNSNSRYYGFSIRLVTDCQ